MNKVNKYNRDFIPGVFTAPRAGVYLITCSYQCGNQPGQVTIVSLYKNGAMMKGIKDYSGYNINSELWSTGGRAVYQRLEAGSTIHLGTDTVKGNMGHIILCVEFINN